MSYLTFRAFFLCAEVLTKVCKKSKKKIIVTFFVHRNFSRRIMKKVLVRSILLIFFKCFMHTQQMWFAAIPMFLLLSSYFSVGGYDLCLSVLIIFSKVAVDLSLMMTWSHVENLLPFFLFLPSRQLHSMQLNVLICSS